MVNNVKLHEKGAVWCKYLVKKKNHHEKILNKCLKCLLQQLKTVTTDLKHNHTRIKRFTSSLWSL